MKKLNSFWMSDDGAVTVDWVVLTAAIVGLAMAAGATTQDGVMSLGDRIKEALQSTDV